MSENRRRVRIKGKGLAVMTCSSPIWMNDTYHFYPRQISRTLGLPRDFDHPDIEVFFRLSSEEYSTPLLNKIHSDIKNGKRYTQGDIMTFKGEFDEEYTVLFRDSISYGEQVLRAVILELDQEYQALDTAEAIIWIEETLKNACE
jgi:hypothetical protein